MRLCRPTYPAPRDILPRRRGLFVSAPRVERIGDATLYLGDCRDVLPMLSGVDAVVTDPPYGTGGWRRTEAGNGGNPAGCLVHESWDNGFLDWFLLIKAPVLTFWPAAKTSGLLAMADGTGRRKHRALYMHKLDPKPQVAGRIAWSVEPIWCLSEEGFQLYGATDWISVSTPRLGRDYGATGHPYEKPVECLEWLIQKVAAAVICDPFMGSGTTGVACARLGRCFIGVEAHEPYFDIACRRIEQAYRQPDLFVPRARPSAPVIADLFA